jgi:hypothetical protein
MNRTPSPHSLNKQRAGKEGSLVTDETVREALKLAFGLLDDHDREIARMHASLQAMVNVLSERSPEFRKLHSEAADTLAKGEIAVGEPTSRQIRGMLAKLYL